MGEVAIQLQQAKTAHPTLIVAAAEHAGHRRDAQLFDVFASIQTVFNVHDHLALLTVNYKLIGTGDARTVQQRVHGKGGGAGFHRIEPEGGEVRELFFGVGVGVYRQTTRGKPVLIGIIDGAEITCTEERNHVATRQLRRFKDTETGKAEIGLPFQLSGINAGIIVFKQFRAEVNLPRQMGAGIDGEHAHATTEAHPNVEELRIQLAIFDIVPQRLRGIVLNAVVSLRRQIRQRIGQCARRTAPRFLRKIVRHGLQHG